MSLIVLGLAEELRGRVAVNALWPQTLIAAAAIRNLRGQEAIKHCRNPEIMGDAAHAILTKGRDCTGKFLIDEQVLRDEGVPTFLGYSNTPDELLQRDLFLDA
jgi:citronellol/citronellal dehydrogenase